MYHLAGNENRKLGEEVMTYETDSHYYRFQKPKTKSGIRKDICNGQDTTQPLLLSVLV